MTGNLGSKVDLRRLGQKKKYVTLLVSLDEICKMNSPSDK